MKGRRQILYDKHPQYDDLNSTCRNSHWTAY